MVAMRNLSILSKILPFAVIAALFSLPLLSMMEDSFYTSFADAIAEVSALVNTDGTAGDCFLTSEPGLSFDADLAPAEGLRQHGERLQSAAKPAMVVLSHEEIIYEIPLPPKIVS
jgi:hypothetical protein